MTTEKSSKRSQSEPEIIPPGKQPGSGVWISRAAHGSHRIFVTRPGPLGIILVAAAIGVILTLVVVLLLGFFLIWIPLIAGVIIIGMVFAFLRGIFVANR
jgi:hypothetical protein